MNFVGVDLNTASPALLRYVSGLNQLTARRLYDFRAQNGPFKSREQLKEVPGFGEAAFVQAAGFLKIGEAETRWMPPGFTRKATSWPTGCSARWNALWPTWPRRKWPRGSANGPNNCSSKRWPRNSTPARCC